MTALVHATCVDLVRHAPWRTEAALPAGVLLLGPSGSGKSDLALRLIDTGARLVADDQTVLSVEAGRLVARAPETLRGRMEIRAVGIVQAPHVESAVVACAFLMTPGRSIARMPEPDPWTPRELPGAPAVPLLQLDPFTAAAAAKLRAAAALLARD